VIVISLMSGIALPGVFKGTSGPAASLAVAHQYNGTPISSTSVPQNMSSPSLGQNMSSSSLGQNLSTASSTSVGPNMASSVVGQNMTSAYLRQNMPSSAVGQNMISPSVGQNMSSSFQGQNMPTTTVGQNMTSTYLGQNTSSSSKQIIQNKPQEDQQVSDDESAKEDESPEVDIVINNVVCSFSVRCHLNLKEIALNGSNVEYRRENGMVTMKLRHPYTTASVWSSGKITCTGANSEEQARVSARKFSRILQKLDVKYKDIRIKNWRIVNVLGTCTLPFAIKITPFSQAFREASYEPELHPGVTYKIKWPRATLKIFSTGSITVTAPSVANVQSAIEHIYPKVLEFQKKKEIDPSKPLPNSARKRKPGQSNGFNIKKPNIALNDDSEDADDLSD